MAEQSKKLDLDQVVTSVLKDRNSQVDDDPFGDSEIIGYIYAERYLEIVSKKYFQSGKDMKPKKASAR